MNRRTLLKSLGAVGTVGGLSGLATANDNSGDNFDIIEAGVNEIHSAFLAGDLTIQKLTEQYIDRIDAYNDELNAVITINPDALSRANELDKELAESGLISPIHGIPILLKDNVDTDNMPTTAGSVLFEDTIPPDDAFIVEQLEDAGGLILAKTNMGEFASGSLSSLGGQTHNPYALPRQTGGSSSGTGAGIAANLGVLGIGTDTGGSIRHPAGFCGLVGLRPTIGLLSRDGIIPVSENLDTPGPMTRTVADAALMMDSMVAYDPSDPETARIRDNLPDGGYVSRLEKDGLDDARIGVLRQLFGPKTDQGTNPEREAEVVTEVINAALDDMAAVGAEIIDPVDIPHLSEIANEVSATIRYYGVEKTLEEYINSLGDAAPVDSVEEIIESGTNEGGRDLRSAVEVDVEKLDENLEYQQVLNQRREVQELILTTMEDKDLDAVVYPMSSRIPPLIDEERSYGTSVNTSIAPAAGFPAMTVPAGFTEKYNLPVGLEFLAGEFEEGNLFELAYSYEQVTMQRHPPENFGTL